MPVPAAFVNVMVPVQDVLITGIVVVGVVSTGVLTAPLWVPPTAVGIPKLPQKVQTPTGEIAA
jgi:hypothetical protein